MKVVFDLDGTLVDSTPDLLVAINRVLTEYDLPISDRLENQRFAGQGLMPMFKATVHSRVPEWTEDKQNLLIREMFDWYNRYPVCYTRAFDGVPQLLNTLQRENIKLCVISNKIYSLTSQIVKTVFPDIIFDRIYGSDSGFPPKPNSDSLKTCRQGMDASEQLIYVGDTEIDYETAKNTADQVFIVTWGYRGKEVLLSKGIKQELLVENPMSLVLMVHHTKER